MRATVPHTLEGWPCASTVVVARSAEVPSSGTDHASAASAVAGVPQLEGERERDHIGGSQVGGGDVVGVGAATDRCQHVGIGERVDAAVHSQRACQTSGDVVVGDRAGEGDVV